MKKSNANGTTYFIYDQAGHVLGSYNGSGNLIEELLYLGDIPVATIRISTDGVTAGVFYIHTDNLNTPRKITNPIDGTIIWRWDSDGFENGAPNQDPDANSSIVQFDGRGAGQIANSETSILTNGLRDLDTPTFRFWEADPVGLNGGSYSLYAALNNNPISFIDPLGLAAFCKQLRKLQEKMQQSTEINRVITNRIPWMQGTPESITFGPGAGIGGRLPGEPGPGIDWRVQFGWLERSELTEIIVWTQYNLWLKECQDTTYDECGNPSTKLSYSREWLEAGRTRTKGNVWTKWDFVPTSPTYTMPGPPF